MKKFSCLFLSIMFLIIITACESSNKSQPSNNTYIDTIPTDYMTTSCSKDYVDEFIDIIGEVELEGLLTGLTLDKEHCFNVTPEAVANQTDIKIFKFSDSCISLALIEGKAYSICNSFGGYGFVNAVPWDYDEDGNLDLLVASSWGSGLHRSEISVFNTTTKESILVYNTATTDNPSIDLFVATDSPNSSSEDHNDVPIYYQIYSANIEMQNDNFAHLHYTATDIIGSVSAANGVLSFNPIVE